MAGERYVLGVDLGGSKVEVRLVSFDRLTVGVAGSEGGNLHLAGPVRAAEVVAFLTKNLLASHRIHQVEVMVVGAAGAGDPQLREDLERALKVHLPEVKRVQVLTDAEIALEGALAGKPGVVVIAGTGSIAMGRDRRGRVVRAGGYGHLINDEGSSYWIGREGLDAAIRSFEGRGPKSTLEDVFFGALAVSSPSEVPARLREQSDPKRYLASLAPLVLAEWQAGDPVATRIVQKAASELAELVRSVAQRLGSLRPLQVRAVGGLFRDAAFFRLFRQEVIQRIPEARVAVAERPPSFGAALIALRLAGRRPSAPPPPP